MNIQQQNEAPHMLKPGDVVKTYLHDCLMSIKIIRGTVATCTWFDKENQINQEGFLVSELEFVR